LKSAFTHILSVTKVQTKDIFMTGIKLISCFLTIGFVSCNQPKPIAKTLAESLDKKTILAILAHPDDEFFISPLLVKYNMEDIHWVVAANGDLGVREHANIPAGDSLKQVRRKEAMCTSKTLNIKAPIFLDYGDGTLNVWENFYPLSQKIDSLFSLLKPDVVITWGPEGGYGHPDHRMIGNITTEVFQKRPISEKSKLFYYGIPLTTLDSITSFNSEGGEWLTTSMLGTHKKYLTYRIPYSASDLSIGRNALSCNKSQFTTEEIDDIFRLVSMSDYVYLRPYKNSGDINYDLFD